MGYVIARNSDGEKYLCEEAVEDQDTNPPGAIRSGWTSRLEEAIVYANRLVAHQQLVAAIGPHWRKRTEVRILEVVGHEPGGAA